VKRVWEYPRPPAVVPCQRRVSVELAGEVLAKSTHALRVLETSHPPTIYIPPADVRRIFLTESPTHPTKCEFKGNRTLSRRDRRRTAIHRGWLVLPEPGGRV